MCQVNNSDDLYRQLGLLVNHPPSRVFLAIAIFIAVLAVSTASIFIRFAQQDAPSLVVAALRLTLASLLLAPVALTHHRTELRSLTRRELLLALLSGIFLAVHFATWISSLEYTTVASSVVLVSTGPLWVALLSPLFLREPLTRFVAVGMLLALSGGTIIGLSDACPPDLAHAATGPLLGLSCPPFGELMRGRAFFGNFLALTGAWAVTGYLLIGRKLRVKISLGAYIFTVYGMAAVTLLVIMSAAGETPFGYPLTTYIWLLLLALLPQLIGHSTYNWALRYLPAAFVAVTTLGEPIGSTILAYFILRESPAPLKIAGGVLILAGIYIASRRDVVGQAQAEGPVDG
jgi:drug/metabolite transporter (DMT)-like permease